MILFSLLLLYNLEECWNGEQLNQTDHFSYGKDYEATLWKTIKGKKEGVHVQTEQQLANKLTLQTTPLAGD